MRKELYKAVAERYLQKYEALNKRVQNSCCSFRDIAANLVSSLMGSARLISKGETDWKQEFVLSLRSSRDYFRLLGQNEQFLLDELSKHEGHFPDLKQKAYSLASREEQERLFGNAPACHDHYVYLAKQRLSKR